MSSNMNGFEYETTVIEAIREAGFSGNITKGAGASAAAADADFFLNGKTHLVEVKLNSKAQMGGSSVRFERGHAELVKSTGEDVEELLLGMVESLGKPLRALLRRLSELEGKNLTRFPLRCTKEHWTMAQNEGLLVNTKISADISFIAKHYRSKGVNYIQFGDAGLFHLGSNPAKLPVPKLAGTVKLEVRTARSGSKIISGSEDEKVTGAIRVQGRLSLTAQSDYTLDDARSIRVMFGALKQG